MTYCSKRHAKDRVRSTRPAGEGETVPIAATAVAEVTQIALLECPESFLLVGVLDAEAEYGAAIRRLDFRDSGVCENSEHRDCQVELLGHTLHFFLIRCAVALGRLVPVGWLVSSLI